MAISLDGQQKVTYRKPGSYKAPSKVTYKASNFLVQQKKAQDAAAARYQAQANQYQQQQNKPPAFYQLQTPFQNQFQQTQIQPEVRLPAYTMKNMKPLFQGMDAINDKMNKGSTKPYDPVTNPGGYKTAFVAADKYLSNTYGHNWRQNPRFSSILMTQDEWLKRRNAANYRLDFYNDYLNKAAQSPNQSHDIYSQWYQDNPNPIHNYWVTGSEWAKRNAAAPPGYMWTPFGSSFAKLNTTPQAPAPTPDYSGGGYADYGGYGGGGGGGSYNPPPPEWWVEMVNWRI